MLLEVTSNICWEIQFILENDFKKFRRLVFFVVRF